MTFSNLFKSDPDPPKLSSFKDWAIVDIFHADTNPLPMLDEMQRKGWMLVTSYPFNGAWRIRFVFRRTA